MVVETHSGLATTLASDWLDNIIGDTPMRDEADHAAHLVRGVLETAILHIATPAAEPPAAAEQPPPAASAGPKRSLEIAQPIASARDNSTPIRLLCFTWNVGNTPPLAAELEEWLPDECDYDIVVVGTQENDFAETRRKSADSVDSGGDGSVAELSSDEEDTERTMGESSHRAPGEAVMQTPPRQPAELAVRVQNEASLRISGAESSATGKVLAEASKLRGAIAPKLNSVWDDMVLEKLGPRYMVCQHEVLWQMRLTVYARKEHMQGPFACITQVQTGQSATGIGGVLGNKGGLLIKLNFGATSLAFLSCHLAAHSHKLQKRNLDCQEVGPAVY